MTSEPCRIWSYDRFVDELRSFYHAQFGIQLPPDLRFASEDRMAGGAVVRTHTAHERVVVRPHLFEDMAAFGRTYAILQSRSIFTLTLVLVVIDAGTGYFVYEVSPRGWSNTGIAHIMMTHALPDPGYQLVIERCVPPRSSAG